MNRDDRGTQNKPEEHRENMPKQTPDRPQQNPQQNPQQPGQREQRSN